jgi:hypothetical protein
VNEGAGVYLILKCFGRQNIGQNINQRMIEEMIDNRDIPKNAVTFCNKCQLRKNYTATCTKYPNGIPDEVATQKTPCKEFKLIQEKHK